MNGSEVLTKLLMKNQPNPISFATRRLSLLQPQGLDKVLSNRRRDSTNEVFFRRRQSVDARKATYKITSILGKDDVEKELQGIYQKFGNSQNKVTAKIIYEGIKKKTQLKQFTDTFYKNFKFKMNNEVAYEEVCKNCLRRNSQLFVKTEDKTVNCDEEMKELDPHEVSKIRNLFDKYDLNRDGFITLNELKRALREKMSSEGISMMFKENDSKNAGRLEFEDFVRMYQPKKVRLPSI